MSETYTPSGGVGTSLKRATSGEATGTYGSEFARGNITTIADKVRFLNDAGTIAEESPITPTLLNSATGATVRYYKARNGRVHLHGVISRGSGNTMFTLPAGYRPLTAVRTFPVVSGATGVSNYVQVSTNGDVITSFVDGTITLDHISFLPA